MVCEKLKAKVEILKPNVLILVLMEYGLRANLLVQNGITTWSLNPCFNGIWSASSSIPLEEMLSILSVLILVLMEYGLRVVHIISTIISQLGLNPCFNGIWSARVPLWMTMVFRLS